VADLPGVWNEKYRQYLGIEPPNDAQGVLQDIHWSAGLFGYFPTYSLGNLYAAQFFAQADKDLGGLNDALRRGEFQPLLSWLREKIHQQGQRFTAAQLAERITQKPLGHSDLINYLLNKMEPLYSAAPTVESTTITEPAESPVVATVGATLATEAAAEATDPSIPSTEYPEPLGTIAAAEHAESESVAATATEEPAPAEQESVAVGENWRLPEAEHAAIDASFDAAAIRTAPRKQAYEIGIVGNLIGVVVFGFVGLALGYWLLNFFGGERFNFLDIWLPFVSRG
jgi:hypothetical protein